MDDLERAAHLQNLDRFARNAQRLERDFGPAATPDGHALIQHHLGKLVEFVRQARAFGRPTRQTYFMRSLTTEAFDLVADIADEDLAQAMLTGVLDFTRVPPKKKKGPGESEVEKGLGRAAKEHIGGEIGLAVRQYYLRTKHPALLEDIERAASYKPTRKKRLAVERKIIRQGALDSIPKWSKTTRFLVGNWGLDCCLQALPGVIVMRDEGTDAVPAIADDAWETGRLLATQRMLRHPIHTPRPNPPEPWIWVTNSQGLPFLENCRDEDEVRKAIVSGQMRPHLDAINYLQGTAYRIDDYMLGFLQQLASWNEPPQLKPLRRLTRSPRDRGPRRVFEWDLEQAEFLRNEVFYIPLSCEWRGRVRPIPYLNYSRGDHIRCLFRFAHGEPIGERGIWWLKVSTANCFGGDISRKTFDERVAWVDDKMPRILELVANPFSGLRWMDKKPWLEEASDPFQFLSHAKELVACDNNPEFVTTLPLPFDASNSGAQHYSLLARDPVGARLTNLIDDGKPNDLYTTIADAIWSRLNTIVAVGKEWCGEEAVHRAMWWRSREHLIGRKGIKSLVMTFLYGQSSPGQQVDLFDILSEDEHELLFDKIVHVKDELGGWTVRRRRPTRDDIPKGHIKWLTEIVREEIEIALSGVVEIMNFVRGTADVLGALKGRALQWSSPSGVPIYHQYLEPDIRVRRTYLGETLHRHVVADGWLPELRKSKCTLSSAPNLIHSFDGSHLAFVALACEAERIPLVTVHDSFGTLGCYTDALRAIWLRELRAMYENEKILQGLYDDARAKLGPKVAKVALPAIPERGDLDLDDVNGHYALA